MKLYYTLLFYVQPGQIITVDAVRQPLKWLLCENIDPEKEMSQLVKDQFLLVNKAGEFTSPRLVRRKPGESTKLGHGTTLICLLPGQPTVLPT
jgi:hypothetical protein